MGAPITTVEYLGAVFVKAKTAVTSASILATYSTANFMKMKTAGVKASINNTDMFDVTFDDESYFVTGKTFTFSTDCVIAIGRYVVVT